MTTVAATLAAFVLTLDVGHENLERAARQRLVITEAVLRSAVERVRYLPTALALDPDVRALLAAVDDPSRVATVNTKFETIARVSNVAAIYVLDAAGLTRGASNWDEPLTFIGESYAYRPYFLDAMADKAIANDAMAKDAIATGDSLYFGIGTTTNRPGLFIGKAVKASDGRTTGVVVVKVELEYLQSEWRQAGERVLVSDAAGIVFLASEPAWKYRPFHALDPAVAARVRAARQYGDSALTPLLGGPSRDEPAGKLRLPVGERAVDGILEKVVMPDLGWTLWYFSDTAPARRQALFAALGTGAGCLALIFAFAAEGQRRQRLRAEREMVATLERRVEERTRDLQDTNEQLRAEIAERERATAALRETQDELVHAGKLAVLGQISAAINHEINQPLSALGTYLASSRVFLERGQTDTVQENLKRMSDVTQRIGEIVRHLKVYSRKTRAGETQAVRLHEAAQAALDLIQAKLRSEGISVSCAIDPDAMVRAEPIRLEQVLLNLLVNAVDAMRGAPERRLALTAERLPDSHWRLNVTDSGVGIAEEDLPHVFDPFFTTKEVGDGLGLGLSLSSLIIRDFGGSLSARNGPDGAIFSLVLPAAARP